MDEISKTGVFYESLDLSKGRIVLIKPIFYLMRRLVLAASIILLDHFSIQVVLLFIQVITSIFIIGFVRTEKIQRNKESIIDEILLLLTMYACLCFSEWISNPSMKFNISYILIASLAITIGILLFGILKQSVCQAKHNFRVWRAKRKYMKQRRNFQKTLSFTHQWRI